jgi:hypothetical protein
MVGIGRASSALLGLVNPGDVVLSGQRGCRRALGAGRSSTPVTWHLLAFVSAGDVGDMPCWFGAQ